MSYQRRVVCSANRINGTRLVLGARHFDSLMNTSFLDILDAEVINKNSIEEVENIKNLYRCSEQGFIDQHGVFLTRQEAWKVAEAAGQIIRRVDGDTMNGGTLFSENLY